MGSEKLSPGGGVSSCWAGCTESSGGPGQGLAAVEEAGRREGHPDPLGASSCAQGCAPLTGRPDHTPGWVP